MVKAGYRLGMTLSAFCTTCQRTVYVEKDQTFVCPVCSSPLLETAAGKDEDEAASEEPVAD